MTVARDPARFADDPFARLFPGTVVPTDLFCAVRRPPARRSSAMRALPGPAAVSTACCNDREEKHARPYREAGAAGGGVAWDFSDLRAIYINCTLKRAESSHTQGLADRSIAIMERNGVAVEVIRAVDHDIATGVWPDMTEHGWERDEWLAIFEKIIAADILVLTSPIWLGQKSSVCMRVIERLSR